MRMVSDDPPPPDVGQQVCSIGLFPYFGPSVLCVSPEVAFASVAGHCYPWTFALSFSLTSDFLWAQLEGICNKHECAISFDSLDDKVQGQVRLGAGSSHGDKVIYRSFLSKLKLEVLPLL